MSSTAQDSYGHREEWRRQPDWAPNHSHALTLLYSKTPNETGIMYPCLYIYKQNNEIPKRPIEIIRKNKMNIYKGRGTQEGHKKKFLPKLSIQSFTPPKTKMGTKSWLRNTARSVVRTHNLRQNRFVSVEEFIVFLFLCVCVEHQLKVPAVE